MKPQKPFSKSSPSKPSSKPFSKSSSKSSSKPSSKPQGKRLGRPPWEKPPAPRAPQTSSSTSTPSKPKGLGAEAHVYGRHAVEATLRFQSERASALYFVDHKENLPIVGLAKQLKLPITQVSPDDIDAMVGGRDLVTQGLVLVCSEFPYASVHDFERAPDLTLVLDGVEDPRNLGAAVRAAYALGASLVVVPADRAAGATAAAVKASAGALCRVPFARETNLRRALEILREKGAWIVGAEADGDQAPWDVDLTGPTVLVVGGEDRGLRRLTREICDHVTAIPMPADDMSLNAADAASLLLYEVLRQKKGPGRPAVEKAPKKAKNEAAVDVTAAAAPKLAAPAAAPKKAASKKKPST